MQRFPYVPGLFAAYLPVLHIHFSIFVPQCDILNPIGLYHDFSFWEVILFPPAYLWIPYCMAFIAVLVLKFYLLQGCRRGFLVAATPIISK